MPKNRDAFAFANFDAKQILQRPFFKEWRAKYCVAEDLTDAEILRGLTVTDTDELPELEKKNARLKEISDNLLKFYGWIDRHANYQNGRLEKFRRRAIENSEFTNITREQDLLQRYLSILPTINNLTALASVLLVQTDKKLQAEYQQRFGERLKTARARAGLSRKEVADELNLTANAFGLYETGKRDISITTLIRLARRLNVSADWLIGLK